MIEVGDTYRRIVSNCDIRPSVNANEMRVSFTLTTHRGQTYRIDDDYQSVKETKRAYCQLTIGDLKDAARRVIKQHNLIGV